MLKLVLSSILMLSINFQAHAVDEAELTSADDTLFYTNTLDTAGEVLAQLKQFGFLKQEEDAGIRAFLNKQDISLDTKLVKGKRTGDIIAFGAVKLELLKDMKIKTPSGQIYSFKKTQKADEFFITMFNDLHKTTASVSLFPQAYAEPGFFDQLSGAVNSLVSAAVQVPATAIMGSGAIVLGVPAMVIAGGLNIVYKNRVYCKHGDYEVDQGYSDFYGKRLMSLSMQYSTKKGPRFAEPHLQAAFGAGGEFLTKGLGGEREIKWQVPESMQAAFHGRRVPKCNKRNAAIAQAYLRANAKSDLEEIADQMKNMHMASPLSTPSDSSY